MKVHVKGIDNVQTHPVLPVTPPISLSYHAVTGYE